MLPTPRAVALAALLFFVVQAHSAEILAGRVVAIADGDTITMLDANNVQYKIRLAGIEGSGIWNRLPPAHGRTRVRETGGS